MVFHMDLLSESWRKEKEELCRKTFYLTLDMWRSISNRVVRGAPKF